MARGTRSTLFRSQSSAEDRSSEHPATAVRFNILRDMEANFDELVRAESLRQQLVEEAPDMDVRQNIMLCKTVLIAASDSVAQSPTPPGTA